MSVPYGDADRQQLPDGFGLDEKVFGSLGGRGHEVVLVLLEAVVEPLGGRAPPGPDEGDEDVDAGFGVSDRGGAEGHVVLDLASTGHLLLEGLVALPRADL